jgi:hypothetical protein
MYPLVVMSGGEVNECAISAGKRGLSLIVEAAKWKAAQPKD